MVEQVGGDHYKREYQHWDWAADNLLCYPLAAATKYLYRYPSKGGLQDLEKALSYLKFTVDHWPLRRARDASGFLINTDQLPWPVDICPVIDKITIGDYRSAILRLAMVIANYVEPPLPDPNPKVVELEF